MKNVELFEKFKSSKNLSAIKNAINSEPEERQKKIDKWFQDKVSKLDHSEEHKKKVDAWIKKKVEELENKKKSVNFIEDELSTDTSTFDNFNYVKTFDELNEEQGSGDLPACCCGGKKKAKKIKKGLKKMKWNSFMNEKCGECGSMKKKKNKKKLFEKKKNKREKGVKSDSRKKYKINGPNSPSTGMRNIPGSIQNYTPGNRNL